METKFRLMSSKHSITKRVNRKGLAVYDVHFRVLDQNNKIKQKLIRGFANEKLAERGYLNFVHAKCEPFIPGVSINPRKNIPTLNDLWKEYDQYLYDIMKDSSHIDVQAVFRLHILPVFGKTKIENITKHKLYEFQDLLLSKRKENGELYSVKYVLKVKGYLNGLFKWYSARFDWVNPMPSVIMPNTSKRAKIPQKYEIWTAEDFNKFIKVVEDNKYRVLFFTLFYTGCRKGEALALTPEDWSGKILHIDKTINRKTMNGEAWEITSRKNGGSLNLPVSETLKDELNRYILTNNQNKFLFGGDKPISQTTLTRYFNNWCDAAGVKRIKIHELRHSFVSMCIHHGANQYVVAELIGDTPEQVMETYGHMWDEDLKQLIKKIK